MSAYIAQELERATKIKAARKAAQATESRATAQAALDMALEHYSAYPSNSRAYRITAARERVAAAEARGRKKARSAK